MTISRREMLTGGTVAAAGLAAPTFLRRGAALAQATAASLPPLAQLPLLDATESRAFSMTAAAGSTEFFPGVRSPTLGFDGGYLGPAIRLKTGTAVSAAIENRVAESITVHWHGLLVPGPVDGGPHVPIAAGSTWQPLLEIDQPPATLWYHSHIHGRTGAHVYAGLAGALIVTDGGDAERGLPATAGVDDLLLVLQDKWFDDGGRLSPYRPAMPDLMQGFLGNRIVVNGQVGKYAKVPPGLVRLRLLNAANARTFTLAFQDGRSFSIVGSDQGLLAAPVEVSELRLSPAERAEILVDFASYGTARLVSLPHRTMARGGMMGMMGGDIFSAPFTVLDFAVDPDLPALKSRPPATLDGAAPPRSRPAGARSLVLNDMGMMMGGRGMGMGGRAGGDMFAINGRPFAMDRIDFEAAVGTVERWTVAAEMMAHPFHVHGVQFRVLRENGRAPSPENRGLKDTVLVEGEVELEVHFLRPAPPDKPYMFHCHILEHEDNGLMGQFTAS